MKKTMSMMLLISTFSLSGYAAPNSAIEPTREQTLVQKRKTVGTAMALTSEQEKDFWPVYDDYQIGVNKLNDEIMAVVMKFRVNQQEVSPELAKELRGRAIKVEQKKLDLKKDTCDELEHRLGSIVAGRFYQIETRIEAAHRTEISNQVPLVK